MEHCLNSCLGKTYVPPAESLSPAESSASSIGEGTIYSDRDRDLVDDSRLSFPINLDESIEIGPGLGLSEGPDDYSHLMGVNLNESIEIGLGLSEGPDDYADLTVEPLCSGFASYEHHLVGIPKGVGAFYCELCLDRWIHTRKVFSRCKDCEFIVCELCYDKYILPFH